MYKTEDNRKCALRLNNLVFELMEEGLSNNAIANGIIFALCIHVLNSSFKISDIIIQLKKIYLDIKKALNEEDIDNSQFQIVNDKPINPDWD